MTDIRDAHDQLRVVSSAAFERRRVMNAAEYRVFRVVEAEINAQWNGYRVFSQTALGEIIRSEDRRAHSCINSKRADIVIIAANGLPALVVEYQGGGHYQGNAAARDAVKKEALRRAGVAYIEILRSFTDEDIVQLVRRKLRPAVVGASGGTPFGVWQST